MVRISLSNVREFQQDRSVVVRCRVTGGNTRPYYCLVDSLDIVLSDRSVMHVPSGFVWDLSSVPRFMWGFLPPDGDFELASLIHDYLYIHLDHRGRKFADDEMLLWSKVVSGTANRWSFRNFDNQLRYIAVRMFGWFVWNRNKRMKVL